MMIVIEGLDGSGKTTLINGLKTLFEQSGRKVTQVREPGSTLLSEKIRDLLKNPEYKDSMTDISELLLFYAARRSVLEHVTGPALLRKDIVLYDRFNVSTVAYQGLGLGLLQEVQSLTKMVLGNFKPDIYIYVDTPEDVAAKRRLEATGLDRIEQKGATYLKRVRQGFDIALRDCGSPYIVVDGTLPIAELANITFEALLEFYHRDYNYVTSPSKITSLGV